MNASIASVRTLTRRGMKQIARMLDKLSGGRVTPNAVTYFGFAMHIPIALLIATDHLIVGGIALIIFGLFDTLDGELARLKQMVTNSGGFLDASTDRFKEVLLYTAAAYLFASGSHPTYAAIAVAACGASICVSFVKAKGEAIVATTRQTIGYPELNKMFSGGLFPFEVRMAVLVLGLLADQLVVAVAIIAVFSAAAACQRLVTIARRIG
ncbi:MAG TPA: CDP-alcohol phosphatidyltransferase family protein [Candidatus Saccharimonadales bacterium]